MYVSSIVAVIRYAEMSDSHLDDEYDEYNYDQDKLVNSGHSGKRARRPLSRPDACMLMRFRFLYLLPAGKNRSKKEASEHTNHFDPSGHSRKLATKLQNTESNKKDENLKPHPLTKK